jgi:hypothetical protein
MTTIAPCTTEDCATVAELWNAKRLDAASCWYGADGVDEDYIAGMLAWGFEIFLARNDDLPVGFGLWCAAVGAARLIAIAANDDETYYRLLLAFCDWGLAAGAPSGYAEIGTAATTERGRMDALGVIEVMPIGFEPLLNGQSPAERVPKLLRAECALDVLRAAVNQILEPTP